MHLTVQTDFADDFTHSPAILDFTVYQMFTLNIVSSINPSD